MMKRCLIVYHSLYGTTEVVAKAIAAGLALGGYQVVTHNLLDGAVPDPRQYDLFGLGAPVYYYQLPFNVAAYIKSLPELDNLPSFTFLLYGTYAFDTATTLQRMLKKRRAALRGHFQCKGADIYYGYLKRGFLFSPDCPTATEIAQAEAFGRAISASGQMQERRPPYAQPGLVYRLERLIVKRWMVAHIAQPAFRVDPQRCNACGVCRSACPMQNIVVYAGGQPTWQRNCLLCLNCELKCPQGAIRSIADWPIFRILIIRNTRCAAADAGIALRRV